MGLKQASPAIYAAVGACGGVGGVLLVQFLLDRWRAAKPAKSSRDAVTDGKDIFVDQSELQAVIAGCLEKAGCLASHAKLVADVLVAADRRNVPSHGVNRCEHYCDEIEAGLVDGKATPVVEVQGPSTCLINGRNALGAVVSKFAMERCIALARTTGVGVVVCHRTNHFGIAGYWSELALREGLIAFTFTNTSPFMIPTRGTQRACGTNPICCFCPAANGDSFQLDMATTTVPVGKVEVMYRKQQSLPFGWGFNKDGLPTTNPGEILVGGGLSPLGGMEETAGYKGYGLSMLVEILCGVLGGCPKVGPDVPKWTKTRGCQLDYGHCFLCIDTRRFAAGFEDRLASYLSTMRSQPPSGSENVLVPGDPERAEDESCKGRGVRLNEAVAASIRRLAARQGVALPSVLQDVHVSKEVSHLMA